VFRRILLFVAVIGLGFIVARSRRAAIEPQVLVLPAWVDAVNGECPPTHPVKAKLSSGIFHVPGGAMYARTKPDRCYRDPAAAESDGLRPAKR
ncbi:MAG: hypothetical protein JO086_12595, partial [Acidimicrobiia bacterium]|nr:hypothetical protein [Acidimicrobiia bacterium]